jgi:hypothetical protein
VNKAQNQEIKDFEDMRQKVAKAHDSILEKLFGFIPDNPGDYEVSREDYKKAMEEVEKEFNIKEGDEAFLPFIFEQLSRSPRFKEEL